MQGSFYSTEGEESTHEIAKTIASLTTTQSSLPDHPHPTAAIIKAHFKKPPN